MAWSAALSGDFGESRVLPWVALVCAVLVILKVSALVVKRRNTQEHMKYFLGPPAHWLFGNVRQLKLDGTNLDKQVEFGVDYPYAFSLWLGPFVGTLIIHHPDYAKTVLSSTEPKDKLGYGFLEQWLGDGLLVSHGQKWFRHRRLLTAGFHYDVLKPYVKLMSDSANTMLDKWEKHSDSDEAFELFEPISLMTLDSILKCAFSYNSQCQTEGGTNAYIRSVYELGNLVSTRIRTFPYHNDLIFYLSPHGFRWRKACRVAHNHTGEIIRKRKEELKDETELDRIKEKRYLDFLDILLCARDENNKGLSDESIQSEVDTFMFEGHDTTASGLSFILYCLACHPEHQQRCRDEISQVLGGRSDMEWEDLSKIPYTTMCIKESLRLYPPVPGIARSTIKPMTFIDGRSIPAGTRVGINVYCLHRNATVWENPNVFDPLRFLPENVSSRSPHAFVPFSAGPRNCIGKNFAMNEMKTVTALVLQKYELLSDPAKKPKLLPRLVLRSINGIHIKIRPVQPPV